MPNERIVVLGVIQGYRIQEGDESHYEDLRDAFSVADKSYVVFDEPIEKVQAAMNDADLLAFVRDHCKKSFANVEDVYMEVLDALSQDPMEEDDDDVPEDDTWRQECLRAVRGYCCISLAEEYINEAEHQDGYGYWKQFTSIPDLIDDIDRYVAGKKRRTNNYVSGSTKYR